MWEGELEECEWETKIQSLNASVHVHGHVESTTTHRPVVCAKVIIERQKILANVGHTLCIREQAHGGQ